MPNFSDHEFHHIIEKCVTHPVCLSPAPDEEDSIWLLNEIVSPLCTLHVGERGATPKICRVKVGLIPAHGHQESILFMESFGY